MATKEKTNLEPSGTLEGAILRARKNFDDVVKNATNPHFKSRYADLGTYLSAVIPALEAEGVLLTQPLTVVDGITYVLTILTLQDRSSSMSSRLPIPAGITDPQKIGACITYFRRYTLSSLLALAADDDDAESVVRDPAKKPVRTLTIDQCFTHRVEGSVKSAGTPVGDIELAQLELALSNASVMARLTPLDIMAMTRVRDCKADEAHEANKDAE